MAGLSPSQKGRIPAVGKMATWRCGLAAERWPSGLRRTPGTRVYGKLYRGFESLSLRHSLTSRCRPSGFAPVGTSHKLGRPLALRTQRVRNVSAMLRHCLTSRCRPSGFAPVGTSHKLGRPLALRTQRVRNVSAMLRHFPRFANCSATVLPSAGCQLACFTLQTVIPESRDRRLSTPLQPVRGVFGEPKSCRSDPNPRHQLRTPHLVVDQVWRRAKSGHYQITKRTTASGGVGPAPRLVEA